MKRLLSIAVAALVVSLAAAQSSLEFDVVVEGTTAIAVDTVNVDGDFLNDLEISYSLLSDEPLTFTGSSSFELRYITNEVGTPAEIQQENWVEVEVEEGISGWEPQGYNTASVGQFKPARITIAAGAVDNGNLVAVPAFDGALALRVSTEACKVPVYAADFPVPSGFPAIPRGSNEPIPAVDFSALEKELAKAYIGRSEAERQGGSIVVAFDAQEVDFIGRVTNGSNYQQSWIRGAACGPNAGQGMTVTVLPEISTDALLPEGTTEVAIVLTIKGEDQ
jgi:hypothetical protein